MRFHLAPLKYGGSGHQAVSATQAVPVLVSEEQGATIGGASGDEDHVVAGDVEVPLQVVIDVPRDLRYRARPKQAGKVPQSNVVGLVIVQSVFVLRHLALLDRLGVAGG